jgi:hypothetical protein
MTYVRFDDWSRLPGAEVWQNGSLLGTGTIDSVTRDSAVAWIICEPIGDRFLAEKANGIELRISREQFIRRRNPGSPAAKSNKAA